MNAKALLLCFWRMCGLRWFCVGIEDGMADGVGMMWLCSLWFEVRRGGGRTRKRE